MIDFDEKVQTVLAEYHQRMANENTLMKSLPKKEGMKRRDEFLLPVGEEVGRFLNAMVRGVNSKNILEIGTSYGYSTVWLAEAASKTGGKVTTLEIDEKKAAYSKSKLEQAGLIKNIDFKVGNALEYLAGLQSSNDENQFDFVLVDIWKELYVPCFELFLPLLKKGAYVICDNMLYPEIHRKEASEYRTAIEASGAFDTVLLPIGSGIEVSLLKSKE